MMAWVQIFVALIGPILSAIVAWKISSMFGCRLYERHEKERILRQILISKVDIDWCEYVKCLSYIELAFSEDKNVLDAWRLLLRAYNSTEINSLYLEEKRDNLIRAIAKTLRYSDEAVSQLIGRASYIPKWLKDRQEVDNAEVAAKLKQLCKEQER